MSKRFLFLFVIAGIIVLLYKIGTIEYESLRSEIRMSTYAEEIERSNQKIVEYKRRIARNNTPAYRVLQKKRTGTLKFPEEEVIIFSDAVDREIERIEMDSVFRVEVDFGDTSRYGGSTIPQKWNALLFGY